MASNTGLRTIWITLRAVNYTAQVFIDTIKMVAKMQAAQDKLAVSSIRMGTHAMSAGMMFMTLGQSMDNTISKMITENQEIQKLTQAFTPYVAALFTVIGAMEFMLGVEKIYIGLTKSTVAASMYRRVAAYAEAHAWFTTAVAVSSVVGAFLILYQVGQALGATQGIIVGITLAIIGLAIAIAILKNVTTFGISAHKDIAGIIALTAVGAGAGAMVGGLSSGHQMGTRMVEATGPALLHRGEVVYNPATHRPTQIGNDLEGGRGPSTTIFQMPMNIRELHTKADTDEVDETIRRSWRRITRNNRR